MERVLARGARAAEQRRLDDLGTCLHDTAFVVVDLETTGGSPTSSRITEVGAVRIRGGSVEGEFHSLVDPRAGIPAAVSALTGITSATVRGQPPIEAVLPAFLEFARGAALVAHNARFDVGFLNANLTRLDYPRLACAVVDTAALARRLIRDEVRDVRLATLAAHFRTRTRPTHRALADARATVEVFHSLLERAGSLGVTTLEDLTGLCRVADAPLFRARRRLADGLPREPGVYAFRSAAGEVLYVGKATDLRARVRQYFGGDERRWVAGMLREAAAVDHQVTATPLEAAVRELRLIRAHTPRYNRRSTQPQRGVYLKLTVERFPRLSVVRGPREDGAVYLGPLASRRVAERVAEAVHDAVPLRRCSARIGPSTRFPACALAELGRCAAPCDGRIDPAGYAAVAAGAAAALGGDATVLDCLAARMHALAASGRYEEAATARDRLAALVAGVTRARRLRRTAASPEILAWRPRSGGVDVVLVRFGKLIASARCAPGEGAAAAAALRRAHPPSLDDDGRLAGGLVPAVEAEEVDLVARWLDGTGVRLAWAEGGLADPPAAGARLAELEAALAAARRPTGRPAAELGAKRIRRPAGQPGAQAHEEGPVAAGGARLPP